MFHGKMKALTFSYDDGIYQDKRLIQILDRYHLKATFNLNSELFGEQKQLIRKEKKIDWNHFEEKDIARVYRGHEVAAHTLKHKRLTELSDEEVIYEVEQDRINLSKLVGYDVVGMAYPCGGVNYDERVAKIIKCNTGVRYARTICTTDAFDLQENIYTFHPTAFHMEFDKLYQLGEQFLKAKPDRPMLFYIWGHSFEFDIDDTWEKFERFCEYISGHADVFYGTNREVFGI